MLAMPHILSNIATFLFKKKKIKIDFLFQNIFIVLPFYTELQNCENVLEVNQVDEPTFLFHVCFFLFYPAKYTETQQKF